MENLRLGVSAVRHDMKREETVEEVEKNTEWEHHTPKRKAAGSTPVQGARRPRDNPAAAFCRNRTKAKRASTLRPWGRGGRAFLCPGFPRRHPRRQ